MLEEEALDLTHYISHTGQVSLFGCVIEFDLLNEKNPKPNVHRECRENARGVARLIVKSVLVRPILSYFENTLGDF